MLAAGGGAITVEQAEIYDLFATDEHAVLRRAGDMVIVSADSKGNVSGTASAVLSKYERFPSTSTCVSCYGSHVRLQWLSVNELVNELVGCCVQLAGGRIVQTNGCNQRRRGNPTRTFKSIL